MQQGGFVAVHTGVGLYGRRKQFYNDCMQSALKDGVEGVKQGNAQTGTVNATKFMEVGAMACSLQYFLEGNGDWGSFATRYFCSILSYVIW